LISRDTPKIDIETCELDKGQLLKLAQKTKLIVATVGPFVKYGEPVLAACAESGTHYLDCTGEVPWIYNMISKYHETAKKNGAIIIPECGLDSVPADLMSFAITSYIRKTLNAPTANVVMSLYDSKTGVSGGTAHTIVGLFDEFSLTHMAKSMEPFSSQIPTSIFMPNSLSFARYASPSVAGVSMPPPSLPASVSASLPLKMTSAAAESVSPVIS
jgi:hypothetical protein